MKTPGVMIAAVKSGSGKTTITCAFLKQLLCRKKHPVSFKCGPDYIDPMFHEQVLKIPSKNLIVWKANINSCSCLSLNVKIFFKIICWRINKYE